MDVNADFHPELVGQISQDFALIQNLLLRPKIVEPFDDAGLQLFPNATNCHELGGEKAKAAGEDLVCARL